MTTYICTFTARKVGAIGVFYPNTREVEAENEEAARLKLYEEFDHIHNFKAVPKEQTATA
jgi:hypothetical protein